MTRIVLIGSTGSVGRLALEVIRWLGPEYEVFALAAGKNFPGLLKQVEEHSPRYAIIAEPSRYPALKAALKGSKTQARCGPEELEMVASHPDVDLVLLASYGDGVLPALLAALRGSKRVGLASKELLVSFGKVVMAEAARHHALILPVDSEHSGIHQCLKGHDRSAVRRVILTASGGPLLSRVDLNEVKVEEALRHPVWPMGPKISIDSATLMNKGLEVVEAGWLFGFSPDQIDVLIHPQSLVHSLVEFQDGAVLAQLAWPDMRLPIQYAITFPKRVPSPVRPLDLTQLGRLKFEYPDLERFPCLRLAYEAARKGGTAPAVLSGADDVAVELFLNGHISFMDIPRLIEAALAAHHFIPDPTLEELQAAQSWAREYLRSVGRR